MLHFFLKDQLFVTVVTVSPFNITETPLAKKHHGQHLWVDRAKEAGGLRGFQKVDSILRKCYFVLQESRLVNDFGVPIFGEFLSCTKT